MKFKERREIFSNGKLNHHKHKKSLVLKCRLYSAKLMKAIRLSQ